MSTSFGRKLQQKPNLLIDHSTGFSPCDKEQKTNIHRHCWKKKPKCTKFKGDTCKEEEDIASTKSREILQTFELGGNLKPPSPPTTTTTTTIQTSL